MGWGWGAGGTWQLEGIVRGGSAVERDHFHLLWIKHSRTSVMLWIPGAVPGSCPDPASGKERGKSLAMQMLEEQEMPQPGVLTAVNG